MWAMFLPKEAHYGLSAQSFNCRLVTQAPSVQHVPKFQTPRRKAGTRHKPHCMSGLGTVRHFSICGNFYHSTGNCLPAKVSNDSQGPILQAGLSKDNDSCCSLFCTLCLFATLIFNSPFSYLLGLFSLISGLNQSRLCSKANIGLGAQRLGSCHIVYSPLTHCMTLG